MIHYLQYQAYVAKDKSTAVLNLDKKWFQDWFNVFDLYNIANINYCTTIRIPYTSSNFVNDQIAKFYVTGIYVQDNMVQLELLFFQSQNQWLDSNNEMLGQVIINGKKDFLLTLYVPIAQIKTDKNKDYATILDYICSTFTQCVNKQFEI